jgi:hypothetical protein
MPGLVPEIAAAPCPAEYAAVRDEAGTYLGCIEIARWAESDAPA